MMTFSNFSFKGAGSSWRAFLASCLNLLGVMRTLAKQRSEFRGQRSEKRTASLLTSNL